MSGEAALEDLPRLAQSVVGPSSAVRYVIEGRVDDQGHPGALMTLSARLLLRCERCNQPLEFALAREVPFRFVASEQELNALPIVDDELEDVVGSAAMALLAWVEDEAILSLPLVARHLDCNPAGAELLSDGSRPRPFAALAALKKGGDGGAQGQ